MSGIRHLYMWLANRLYDELAWLYDPISRMLSMGRLPAWRCATLEHVKGRRVLEIGIGTGESDTSGKAGGLKMWTAQSGCKPLAT